MLINAPPVVCGEAFRRDGYCRFESGKRAFSKNELGSVHNFKSLTVQAQGWKRHYSTPFWNGLLFLTQKCRLKRGFR